MFSKIAIKWLSFKKEKFMYLVDSHVHLEKGPLTKEYVLELFNEAIKNNIDELHQQTSHNDYRQVRNF